MRLSAKKWMLLALSCGLCLSTLANTTLAATDDATQGTKPAASPGDAPSPSTSLSMPSTPDQPAKDETPPWRLSLLLPLRSDSLKNAALAVRAGFMAAYEQDKSGIVVNTIETSDVPEEVLSDYTNSLDTTDIVIGPLTRSSAAAIAESGAVRLPTISLTQSDAGTAGTTEIPPLMLTMGLSVEDEARQVAGWIANNKTLSKVYVLSTKASWQRRAARAFVAKAKTLGLSVQVFELSATDDYLNMEDLLQLKKRIAAEKPGIAFVALEADQARQVREVIGIDTAIYGTSQLNPLALPDWTTTEHIPEMNGMRLLDIPWQLEPDHPAVMIYPHLVIPADQKRSADMERLYALGIDAFRVARMLTTKRKQFEVDGVTGKLHVNFDKDHAYFERVEPLAIYRAGVVIPYNGKQ